MNAYFQIPSRPIPEEVKPLLQYVNMSLLVQGGGELTGDEAALYINLCEKFKNWPAMDEEED